MIIAACIVAPAVRGSTLRPVGRAQRPLASGGDPMLLLLGWAAVPLQGLLLALLPGPWLPIFALAIGGISAAVFGVMLPLLAADITRGSSHFNLCMGALGLAVYLGAALSTTLGGWVADWAGTNVAFVALACVGLSGRPAAGWQCPRTTSRITRSTSRPESIGA